MTLYAFQNKRTAESLNRFAKTLDPAASTVSRSNGFLTPSMVMKTNSSGIPARTGDQAGVAKCKMLGSAPDGTMTELGPEADVLNPFSSAIAGDTYIFVSVCQEVLVVVAEDPETNKSWILQTPAGGIPARSGTSAGSASCTPYYIDSSGTLTEQLDDSNASQTFTVYNVSASAVSGSAYIQAKNVKGKLVVDMEDCG